MSLVAEEGGSFNLCRDRDMGNQCAIFAIENDNSKREERDETTIKSLLSGIDHAAREDASKYVDRELPISWFRFYDMLAEHTSTKVSGASAVVSSPRGNQRPRRPSALFHDMGGVSLGSPTHSAGRTQFDPKSHLDGSKSVLNLSNVMKMGIQCGLQPAVVVPALEFMHELGTVLFYNEPDLKDHVILNPQWLITAIGQVIRNWKADYHQSKQIDQLREIKDFEHLKMNALASKHLLTKIWADYNPKEQKMLISLMSKFGLMCEWFGRINSSSDSQQYLIPSLLLDNVNPSFLDIDQSTLVAKGYLVFYIQSEKPLPFPWWSRLMCLIVRRANVSHAFLNPPNTDYTRTTVRTYFEKYLIQADFQEDERRVRIIIFNNGEANGTDGGPFVLKLIKDMAQAVSDDFFSRQWQQTINVTRPGGGEGEGEGEGGGEDANEVDFQRLQNAHLRQQIEFSQGVSTTFRTRRTSDSHSRRRSSVHFHKVEDYMCWLVPHQVLTQQDDEPVAQENREGRIQLPNGCKHHFFLSHVQKTGQDIASSLCYKMREKGFDVWYDMEMNRIDGDGMKEGVKNSHCFVLLLTEGILSRKWVRLEIATAIENEKKILLIHDPGSLHSFNFNKVDAAVKMAREADENPVDLSFLFDASVPTPKWCVPQFREAIAYRRRKFESDAMIGELARRAEIQQDKTARKDYLPAMIVVKEQNMHTVVVTSPVVVGGATGGVMTMARATTGRATGGGSQPSIDLRSTSDNLFQRLDKNGDGVLDANEFAQGQVEMMRNIVSYTTAAVLDGTKTNPVTNDLVGSSSSGGSGSSGSRGDDELSHEDLCMFVYGAADVIKELRKTEGKKKWPKSKKKIIMTCKQKLMKETFDVIEFEQLRKHLERSSKTPRYLHAASEQERMLLILEELLEFFDWDSDSDDEDD